MKIKDIRIKQSENEDLSLKVDKKISDMLNKLISIDPLDKYNPKYIISIKDQKEITVEKFFKNLDDVQKEEEVIDHPFFKEGNPLLRNINNSNVNSLDIDKLENIIIFSPHPDDDILGSCALIYKLIVAKKKMKVVYMTSGKSAGGANIRQEEAINAICVLGGTKDNVEFIHLPFYDHPERLITDIDIEYMKKYLGENKPDNIFICADIFDPHLTHKYCYEVLLKTLELIRPSKIQAYFYYSVWYIPKDNEYTHIIDYDFDIYKLKVNAMLEHKSQFETKFMGHDPRPFYQRAIARDSNYGKKYNYQFCEVFYMLNNV